MSLKIKLLIDSVERQANLLETEWSIERNAHGKLDHTTFTIDDPTNAITLTRGKTVVIEDFNWVAFILWFLLAGIGGIVYLIYYASKPSTQCPVCQMDVYGRQGGEVSVNPLAIILIVGIALLLAAVFIFL